MTADHMAASEDFTVVDKENLEAFDRNVLLLLESFGEILEEDEDWNPTMFTTGDFDALGEPAPTGKPLMNVNMLEGRLLQDDSGKLFLSRILSLMAIGHRAKRAAFAVTAWSLHTTKEERERLANAQGDFEAASVFQPKHHPDRVETLMVTVWGDNGEPSGFQGEIDRSGEHPVIKEWMTLGDGGGLAGRMVTPISEAMRMMHGLERDASELMVQAMAGAARDLLAEMGVAPELIAEHA